MEFLDKMNKKEEYKETGFKVLQPELRDKIL
jgi:hypothetical protein